MNLLIRVREARSCLETNILTMLEQLLLNLQRLFFSKRLQTELLTFILTFPSIC
jgi:hypothetical protein